VITPSEDSVIPRVDARLARDKWDIATTGFGVTAGAVIGHVPGALVGGALGFGLGRVRWIQVRRST
jgi:hypothetical protein